ncbi:MAG: beta-ketoacyl-ACP synthase [Gammaproteobacteria bacterium]|nr:MAG: beta-ketoacyl-ACP synthase [Gammaproteobacteria bacterium]
MKRVVVTGMAGISPIGSDWDTVATNLKEMNSAVEYMEEWEKYEGLNTKLAAPVKDFSRPKHYSRKETRSMGRVALMATRATELALEDAGLLEDESIKDGKMGVSYGSCGGTPDAMKDFGNMLLNNNLDGLNSTSYIKMMSHTAAVNIGVFFGLKGRIIPTASACTSGSQGIGYAYEAIKFGRQKLMVAGGAEELCPSEAAVFDTLFATSIKNDAPKTTPRPYDADRDGLVIGEGAGTFILEEYEHAKARGAHIYAEVVGFACNSDGRHVTQPHKETMRIVMEMALEDAGLKPSDIGYVNAHGTSTEHGDIAESTATEELFGNQILLSSLKSYTGHTLGACGVLEAWMTINMQRENWYAPTINLDNIDERCGNIDYIRGGIREGLDFSYVMSNNFAFGGINTSLIFKKM